MNIVRFNRLLDCWPALIGAVPVLVAIGLCQRMILPADMAPSANSSDVFVQMSRLPGRAGDAPLVAAQDAAPTAGALARNAAVPFFAGRIIPAVPFAFSGSPADQGRATQCLALAAMAEAGPSDQGQRAVIQVVLNRVRHPAFAKTVCGVVFEGSQRQTGCQFSFTCDGSLVRRYSDAAWAAARGRAAAALAGQVYAPVGNATHYHTDWVYPYWSPSLIKLAKVDTHLFFRWPGYWGTPAAMRVPYRGGEPDPLAAPGAAAPAAGTADITPPTAPTLASVPPPITGGRALMRDPTGKANFVALSPGTSASAATTLARKLCPAEGSCRVLGWTNPMEIPAAFPMPPAARATLKFSFTRSPDGAEIVLFDCQRFPGLPREQCIPKAR